MNYRVVNVVDFVDGEGICNIKYCKFDSNIDDPSANVGVIFLSCDIKVMIGLFYDGVYYINDRYFSRHYVFKMLTRGGDYMKLIKLWDGYWCDVSRECAMGPLANNRVGEMCSIVREVESVDTPVA